MKLDEKGFLFYILIVLFPYYYSDIIYIYIEYKTTECHVNLISNTDIMNK